MALRRALSLSLLASMCFFAMTVESQAGPIDSAGNWLLGLVLAAVAGAAGGYHVANKRAAFVSEPTTAGLPVTAPAVLEGGAEICRVWYATNALDGPIDEKQPDAKLAYGICDVAVPASHKFGSTGSGPVVRLWQRVTTGSDDALRIIARYGPSGPMAFVGSLKDHLNDRKNRILIYIHGYRVSFDDAILRAAQIGVDVNVPGVVAAFYWHSRATLLGYAADEDEARLAELRLAEFLTLLHAHFPDNTIDFLAHSMGNRPLLGVIEGLAKYPALAGVKFGQLFLAAPDVSVKYFAEVAGAYRAVSQRTTLYVCAKDRALEFSGADHVNDRVGYVPPVTIVEGIDTIEATNVSLDLLGHGYYAQASAVLHDMYDLLRADTPPPRQSMLRQQTPAGLTYWQLRSSAA